MNNKVLLGFLLSFFLAGMLVLSGCNGANPGALNDFSGGNTMNYTTNHTSPPGATANNSDNKTLPGATAKNVPSTSGFGNSATNPPSTDPPYPSGVPTGYECNYKATTVPVHQGLLDYTIASSLSNPDSKNKVTMSRRFSMVDKNLASQYLLLQDFGDYKQGDTVFSMLEYYACIIPDWLYNKLDGLYLVKYDGEHVARASVMVFKDRNTTEYVAQLLLALSGDDLQFKWVNGNYVAYTAQKAYWWTHGNTIVRIASHTTPMKANATGVTQEPSYNFSICETLDVLGSMDQAKCLHDQFWQEVPEDILFAYLNKLPSDGENITWPEPGQFASLIEDANWPTTNEVGEYQWGCDPERNKEINDAFAAMGDVFNGSKDSQREKTFSRLEDGAKVTEAYTDKRWYYLGEPVTIFGKVLTADEQQGTVTAEVNKDIFPHPETDVLTMKATECGNRETFMEKNTGFSTNDLKNSGKRR